jgi:hypothetical protein
VRDRSGRVYLPKVLYLTYSTILTYFPILPLIIPCVSSHLGRARPKDRKEPQDPRGWGRVLGIARGIGYIGSACIPRGSMWGD